MELWTEYEGRTIDGGFALNKLVLPQGRSAFFSTSNRKGEPTLIRLVACHFDEEEILARWRGVQALNHPHFLKLDDYGQLVLDETNVVYAVFEPVDANLAQVVAQGRLTFTDAVELGCSLTSALQKLHANGFVHEHVEAESVYAVGEEVKLRSDCIRETPEGGEGQEAKKRDVHDLAVVLLQALTQEKTMEAALARRRSLQAPFDKLIPKALTGEWGLAEIDRALSEVDPGRRAKPATNPAATVAPTLASATVAGSSATPAGPSSVKTAPGAGASTAGPRPVVQEVPKPKTEVASEKAALHEPVRLSGRRDREDEFEKRSDRPLSILEKKWIGAAVLLVLLMAWIGWALVYHRGGHKAASTEVSGAAAPATVSQGTTPAPAHTAPRPVAAAPAVPRGGGWRVIAFTYNHKDQAEKKASTVAQKHPDLRPEVFSPTGRAPYLVSIGGWLSHDEASALERRARRLGLPRDTYAQNYETRNR